MGVSGSREGKGGVGVGVRVRAVAPVDTFVQFHLHSTGYTLLGEIDAVHDELHFGGIPKAIITQSRELSTKGVTDTHDLSVHGNAFQIQMSLTEYRARGRFVASTRLDTHESVLHDVNSAHTIGTGNFIEVNEAFQRVSKRSAGGLVDDLTRSSCRRSGERVGGE